MLGSLRRLTLVTLLALLMPSAFAAAPVTNLSSGYSLGGQEVTDIAMEPSGQFVVGVVAVDPAGLVTLPGSVRHDDIYPCSFGAPSSTSGGSCRTPGLQHSSTRRTTTLGAKQAVDYASFTSSGLVARYAVAGPSDTLSLWSFISDTPLWEITVPGNQAVVNVSLSPDAGRVLAGTQPASGAGRLVMYNGTSSSGSNGALLWDFNLTNTRPTSMDYARSGALAAVGASAASATNSGEIIIFRPTDRKPVEGQDLSRFDASAPDVTHVQVSTGGTAVVASTTQHVFFFGVNGATGKVLDNQRWSRQVAGGCQRVAIAGDASLFAAACGNRVVFFRHLGGDLVAQDVGSFDAGQPVADLAYDATGDLLVAIAGNRVYGFGKEKTTPLWSFDATESSNGGLDGPLRKVVVSDGGERVVVAGRTKLMPYRSLVAATATFKEAQRMEVQPASHVQISLTVTNKGSLPDNYTFSARFPPGWTGFSPGGVHLDPEESATVNLTLDVPVAQAPGFYGVEVDVRSETLQRLGRDKPIVASPALNLTVPRFVVLNVTAADDRVPPLRQGGEVTVPITVRNRGNAEGLVNLSTTQLLSRGAPWTIHFDNEQVSVPAGGERTVNLVIDAPADAASGDRNDITVCAREGEPKTCVKGDTSPSQAMRVLTAYVDPKFGAELSTNASTFEFGPGELKVVTVTVLNTGNTDDTFNLTATLSPAGAQNDWHVTLERESIQLARGEKRSVAVTVRAAVNDPRDATLIVKAISVGSALTEDGSLTISLVPRPPVQEKEKSFMPAPPVAALLGLVAVAALLRRRGGA